MTHRTPTDATERVARLADPDATQPINVPADSDGGNGTPTQPPADGAGVHADPTPATASATPAASANGDSRERGPAGAGRPTTIGHRLAGLGMPAQQYLTVLQRIPLGRAQRRLTDYLATAQQLGASEQEARLILAAVEQMIVVAQPVERIDPYDHADKIIRHYFARGEVPA